MFAARNMTFAPWSFNPNSLAPALWLDASDAGTLYNGASLAAADDPISSWRDKSGNGRHVTQATGVSQPLRKTSVLNGKDVIRFDGSNDYLDVSDSGFPTGAATYFSVSYYSDASIPSGNYRSVFHYGTAAAGAAVFDIYTTDGTNGTDSLGVSQYGDGFGQVSRLQTWNIQTIRKPSTTGTWYQKINNLTETSKSMFTSTTLGSQFRVGSFNGSIGAGSYHKGDIAEILVFPTALSNTDRASVESYLNSKWGIY